MTAMHNDKFKGKYRIASARLASWDYGRDAAYFITICTHNRVHAFGTIVKQQVNLALLGQAAWDCWYAIPEHFPFVLLDAFIVMPNHVHGILVIDRPSSVETQHIASPQRPQPPGQPANRFGPQSRNLASIVRGFEIGVTKYAKQHGIPFAWQARYHDHIVRDADDHHRIRVYIVENPQKWAADRFNHHM